MLGNKNQNQKGVWILTIISIALFILFFWFFNAALSQIKEYVKVFANQKGKSIETVSTDKKNFTDSEIHLSSLYKVAKVVDGDTLDIDLNGKNERIRLIGINTPETVDPRKPVECFGKEASAKAKEVLNGKNIYIQSDPSQSDRDKYDRLLRYVYLEDGTNFNLLMIEEGFAYEYTYDVPYKYQQEFQQAQKQAQEDKKGLWADGVCNNK